MTNESPGSAPSQAGRVAPTPVAPVSAQPQRPRKRIWITVVAVVGPLCLCGFLVAAVAGAGLFSVYTEKAPVQSVLDAYMGYMADKDPRSAYALFSPRAHRQVALAQVQDLLEGNNYYIFEGYRSLTVDSINISVTVHPDPNMPQGIVAEVTGTVLYEDGISGTFNGVLEKVGEAWMLDSMFVTVPPDKFP